jgi:CHAT domain-containing protein
MSPLKVLLFFYFFLLGVSSTYAQDHYKQYLNLNYPEIDSLMYIEYRKGAYDKAIPYMQAGREKAKVEFGQQDSVFSKYTVNLGFFYTHTGQYDQALPLYIEGIKIAEKTLGKEHPDFATSLNNLALLHKIMGNFALSLPLMLQSKNIIEKVQGKEHPHFANSLINIGLVHTKMHNLDLALPLFLQAVNIIEEVRGKEHSSFAKSLNNLASCHQKIGNFDLALPLFIQAMNIRKKVLGKEHPDYANSLNNLANLHDEMGNEGLALPLFLQAMNIREKVLGKEHPLFALALNNLASCHSNMGNHDLALPLLLQAINIREKVLGKEHPDYASSLNDLSRLYIKMGTYAKAYDILGFAMNSSSTTKIKHTFSQTWLDTLKDAPYPSNEHLLEMIASLKIAYHVLHEQSDIRKLALEGQNHDKDSTTIALLARQVIVADLATTLLSQAKNQVSNEKDKLRILSLINDWTLRSLKVFNQKEDKFKAFLRADENKSVLLHQATKSEAAYRLGGLPDSLVWKDKKLIKKQSQLQAKLIEKRSKTEKDSLRNELNHINEDLSNFSNRIQKEYPKYHKLKYQQINASLEEIQTLLEDNTALLEYVIGDSTVHIFFVDKTQVEWTKFVITNKELKKRIKALHHALNDYQTIIKNKEKAYRAYSQQAYWFYQNLIAPALNNKQHIQNLIVVTDGELGHLPFETFLVEQAPQQVVDYRKLHYLVNDYNISYNYSATLWKDNAEAPTPSNNGQILGIAANYNIKLDSAFMSVRLSTDQQLRNDLDPLPAARKEVETLQENYQGFFAFDTLASEKTVKEKASDFAILHFATHGILDKKRPMLSSLAFSEDNNSTESNFWQAHEISKIQLNADLVVLSACETGYGEFEAGNGIASLARAFMYAGSSSLIVSLWQVNDYATSEIMKNLYANLANGMKKDEALRQAKVQYIKSAKKALAHPAFWSPFIMMGNTQPVNIKRKSTAMPWMIGGAVGLLALVGFMMSRRKKEIEDKSVA